MVKNQEKQKKNKPIERLRGVFLMMVGIIFIVFLSGFVVSANWDNQGNFNKTHGKYGKYDIRNSVLGIPFFQLNKIVEIELTDNTDSCGISCYAIQDFILYENGTLVDDVTFFTIDGEDRYEQNIRSYKLYYYTEGDKVRVEDYETQCETILVSDNQSGFMEAQNCENVNVGHHFEDAGTWTEFSLGQEFTGKNSGEYYKVKLEGKKRPDRIVDWVYTTAGIVLDEWALWGADNSNIAYYKLDDSPNPASYSTHQQTGDSGYASNSQSAKYGSRFTVKGTPVAVTSIRKSATSTATTGYICSGETAQSCDVIHGTATFIGITATFDTPVFLDSDKTYKAMADSGGAGYDRAYKTGASYPVDNTLLSWNSTGGGDGTEFGQITHMEVGTQATLVVDTIGLFNGTNNDALPQQTGKLNTSYDFDGISDSINLTHILNATKPFTISGWVYPHNPASAPVIGGQDGSTRGISLFIAQGQFAFYNGLTSPNYFVGTMTNDTWNHIAVSYDGAGNLDLYANGIKSSNTSVTMQGAETNIFSLGSNNRGTYGNMSIDEFGIWNRSLSSSEVGDLYNGGNGRSYGTESSVSLNSPADNYISPTNNVLFNATATITGGATLVNMSLWTNETGSWAVRNTTEIGVGGNITIVDNTEINLTGASDQTFYLKSTYNPTEAFNTTMAGASVSSHTGSPTSIVAIQIRYTYVNTTTIIVGGATADETAEAWKQGYGYGNLSLANPHPDEPLDKIEFYVGKRYGNTPFGYAKDFFINSTYTGGTRTWNRTLTSSTLWNVEACDSDDVCGFAGANRTFSFDINPPSITINNPTLVTDLGYVNKNETLNVTVTDGNLESCWYDYNGTNYTAPCTSGFANVSYFLVELDDTNLTLYANDSVGNVNSTFYSWKYTIWENSQTYDAQTTEGNSIAFAINFTYNSSAVTNTQASLVYDGTSYAGTRSGTGDTKQFTRTITAPLVSTTENKTFYWDFTLDSNRYNSTFNNQSVINIDVAECNSTFNATVLNFTINDEETKTIFNVSATNLTFEIDLDFYSQVDGSLINEYYNTFTNQNNISICLSAGTLDDSSYYLDADVFFKEANSHVAEYWFLDNGNLTSSDSLNSLTTKTVNLYDLESADSTSFLFNYYDSNGLAVDDSIVHVFRKYVGTGIFREVERSQSDTNGDTIIHLVEEDVIYYFIVSVDGVIQFTSTTYSALCQEVPCSLTLEDSGSFVVIPTDFDLLDNGAYSFVTSRTGRQVNLTYQFTNASNMTLSIFRFDGDGSYTLIDSETQFSTDGVISLSVPQNAGNRTFFATVEKDGEFITSKWISFDFDLGLFFGDELAIFLSVLIILTIGLIAVTEGIGTLVMVMMGLAMVGVLGLLRLTMSSTGVGLLIYIICAGLIIVYKLARRERE